MSQYPVALPRQAPAPRVRQELRPRYEPDFDLKLNGFGRDFDKAVLAFLAFQDVSHASKKTYARSLKQFKIWIEQEAIDFPTRADILAYKDHLRGHLKALTVSSYLAAVKSFFGWASVTGQYPDVTYKVKGIRQRRQSKPERDSLTKSQALELLNSMRQIALEGQSLSDRRDYAIVSLMIETSIRLIGLTRANIEDLTQHDGVASLRYQGKGRELKDDDKDLGDELTKAINEYILARRTIGKVRDSDPLFMSHSNRNPRGRLTTYTVSKMIKANLRRIGIDSPRITAHSLRHTSITFCDLGGGSVLDQQTLAGHSDIKTTMRYNHSNRRKTNPPERFVRAYLYGKGKNDSPIEA